MQEASIAEGSSFFPQLFRAVILSLLHFLGTHCCQQVR